MIAAISGTVSGASGPLFGSISDSHTGNYGKRAPFLLFGALASVACLMVLALAGELLILWLFAISYIAVNTAVSSAQAPFTGLLPDVVGKEQYGAASGYMGLMIMFGNAFGAGVMGLIATSLAFGPYSYTFPFSLILSINLMLGLVATLWAVKEKPNPPAPAKIEIRTRTEGSRWTRVFRFVKEGIKKIWNAIASPFRSRDFTWVFWTRFLMNAGLSCVQNFLQYWFDDVIGAPFTVFGWFTLPDPKAATSMFLLPLLTGAMIASLTAGILSDKYGRKVLVYASGGVQCASILLMVVFPTMNVAVVVGLVFGLGYGAFASVDFALATDTLPDKDNVAKDLAVWYLSGTLASMVVPILAGVLLDIFKGVGVALWGSPRLGHIVIEGLAFAFFVMATVLVSFISVGGRPVKEALAAVELDAVKKEVGDVSINIEDSVNTEEELIKDDDMDL